MKNHQQLISIFVALMVSGCAKTPAETFERWTGERLPFGLYQPRIAIELASSDYVVGDLIVEGRISREAFLDYVKETGLTKQGHRIFSLPSSPIPAATWWQPPSHPLEVFVKKVSSKGDWVRVVVWEEGKMFLWQDGPFE